jgi:hypothetical protein
MSILIKINKHIELENALLFFSDDKIFTYTKRASWCNGAKPLFMKINLSLKTNDVIYIEDNGKVLIKRHKYNGEFAYFERFTFANDKEMEVVEEEYITPYLQYII